MNWKCLRVKGFPSGEEEALVSEAFDWGVEGIDETESDSLLLYYPAERSDEVSTQFQSLIARGLPGLTSELEYSTECVMDNQWENNWKKYFYAQPIGERFFLRPAWEKEVPIPENRFLIEMEPGQAFGTGLHETTRLCIELLEEQALKFPLGDVLDIGTGTGILAIVSERLGAQSVMAVDNDPIAVEVAIENVQKNLCSKTKCRLSSEIEGILGQYDTVIANILLETHVQFSRSYLSKLRPGAVLILSGLLANQQQEIESVFAGLGKKRNQVMKMGDWIALSFQ